MVSNDRRQPGYLTTRHRPVRRAVVGVDGGGTKTHAVILDMNLNVLGEGLAGPSNPLRVGITNAVASVREAIDKACEVAKVRRSDLVAAEIGLAGTRRHELKVRMRETLKGLGMGEVVVTSDADIALYGATLGAPGLIVDCRYGLELLWNQWQRKKMVRGRLGPDCGRRRGWLVDRAPRFTCHRACHGWTWSGNSVDRNGVRVFSRF